jgi:glycosyltransferase involved in cell wall biosynthesis
MKIIQINNYHYRRGGADVVYLNTGEILQKHGHEVIYFSQKNQKNIDSYNPKDFVNIKDFLSLSWFRKITNIARFFFSFEAMNKISHVIKKERPDIAHIHLYKGVLTPSILIPLKKHNVPVVITVHDFQLLCPHYTFLDGKNRICESCLNGSSFNCVIKKCNHNNYFYSLISFLEFNFNKYILPARIYFSRLIFVSRYSLLKHSEYPGIKDKSVYLYNFSPFINSISPNQRKGVYVLFYGRLVAEKGVRTLLKAWLCKKRGMKLIMVGDGPMKNVCCQIISLASANSVEMIGFRQGSELNELINNSSFIVVPSENYENNPLTVIEAYSFGKPVIGTRTGGIAEIVIENSTGYLFNMYDSNELSTIFDKVETISETDYQELSRNSRSFCEKNFSEDNHFRQLMNIYNVAINEKYIQ